MQYKITDISPQQKGSLLNIAANGEYAFSADPTFIADEDIFIGADYEEAAFETLKKAAETRKAVRHSLYLLERRDFSKKELVKRLCDKGYDEECSVAAAEKVAEMGYINDERYAERIVERNKTRVGSRRILNELSRAGIDRETAETLVSEKYDEQTDGVETVYKEMKRRLKGAPVSDRNAQMKLFNVFRTKGFEFETIKQAYEKYRENEEKTGE